MPEPSLDPAPLPSAATAALSSSAATPHSRLFRWLVRHWACTYVLMGLGFVAFGASSLHLAQYVAANLSFLGMHGFDAIMDGGLWQTLELLLNAYAAVAFYLLFKTCEHALVERLAHPPSDGH